MIIPHIYISIYIHILGSIISCNPRALEPSASGFRSSHVASSSARYRPGWEIPASFCAKYGNIIEENEEMTSHI